MRILIVIVGAFAAACMHGASSEWQRQLMRMGPQAVEYGFSLNDSLPEVRVNRVDKKILEQVSSVERTFFLGPWDSRCTRFFQGETRYVVVFYEECPLDPDTVDGMGFMVIDRDGSIIAGPSAFTPADLFSLETLPHSP